MIRNCDSHHNTGGFSGTDSHGTLVDHNNFYDNALGFTTDVFTAPGHPGFPQHGNLIEDNNFYSNNFNPYQPGSRRRAVHRRSGRHRACGSPAATTTSCATTTSTTTGAAA